MWARTASARRCCRAGAGQRLLRGLLQRRRRPGRAHLRRALRRSRRRGRASSRGLPASRRRCSSSTSNRGHDRPSPARRAPARARPRARAEPEVELVQLPAAAARNGDRIEARSCRGRTIWSRCGSRSSSGCATTSRRTGSRTSSSACRAGSTPPSPQRSPRGRSGPSACIASPCRHGSPRTQPGATRSRSRGTSAPTIASSRSSASSRPTTKRSPKRSRGMSAT